MRPNLNPLHTSFHRPQDHPQPTSPTRSPTSPATTASISSPSPPTSPFYAPRRLHPATTTSSHHHRHQRGRLPFRSHPPPYNPSTNTTTTTTTPDTSPGTSPFRLSASSLPSGLSPRPSPIFPTSTTLVQSHSLTPTHGISLRRRPSRAELALREERWRAREDQIERRGLEMLEPRPGPPCWLGGGSVSAGMGGEDLAMGMGMEMSMDGAVEMDSGCGVLAGAGLREQRVVMGGIFEVMEGRG